jgi:hypothetical protein
MEPLMQAAGLQQQPQLHEKLRQPPPSPMADTDILCHKVSDSICHGLPSPKDDSTLFDQQVKSSVQLSQLAVASDLILGNESMNLSGDITTSTTKSATTSSMLGSSKFRYGDIVILISR